MRIGVFDSGIGGMTVLKDLIQHFPKNTYYYLGDTANVPYGTKSTEQIKNLSRQASFYFKDLNLDFLVVACNTASSLALSDIKDMMDPVPVVSVVEPGVVAILNELQKKDFSVEVPILILGTKATIRSGIYGLELRKQISFNTILEQSCPLAVPFIEEGWIQTSMMKDVLAEYVKPYVASQKPGIALLACTHYPWAQKQFESVLPGWVVVNSASAISKYVADLFPQIKKSEDSFHIEIKWTDPKSVSDIAINDFNDSLGMNLSID